MQSKETQQLLERIFRFNKLMHEQMSHSSDCSVGEMKMISVIAREQEMNEQLGVDEPGVTASRLSECLMHSRPATSKMLNALEEEGEITRIASKKDRRTVYITLTKKGEERASEIKTHIEGKMNLLFERLGEEKSTQLFRIMDDIYEIIHDMKMAEKTKQKKEN